MPLAGSPSPTTCSRPSPPRRPRSATSSPPRGATSPPSSLRQGSTRPVISEPHTTRAGVRCAALPLAVVAGVVVATAPTLAVFFELPIAPGEVWCLVLWGGVGEERAMLVPMRPVTTLAWGSA